MHDEASPPSGELLGVSDASARSPGTSVDPTRSTLPTFPCWIRRLQLAPISNEILASEDELLSTTNIVFTSKHASRLRACYKCSLWLTMVIYATQKPGITKRFNRPRLRQPLQSTTKSPMFPVSRHSSLNVLNEEDELDISKLLY
jgi:hypothetical protein